VYARVCETNAFANACSSLSVDTDNDVFMQSAPAAMLVGMPLRTRTLSTMNPDECNSCMSTHDGDDSSKMVSPVSTVWGSTCKVRRVRCYSDVSLVCVCGAVKSAILVSLLPICTG
jgi:hypothetical protein